MVAIYHTGGVFSYLPHHLDLALEHSGGHSTCMSVLARRRAMMGWCVGSWRAATAGGVDGGFLAVGQVWQFAPPVWLGLGLEG